MVSATSFNTVCEMVILLPNGSYSSMTWFTVITVRHSLPREALLTLVTSFITSKIDNCNVALAGLPSP